jgi:hypothetical protein
MTPNIRGYPSIKIYVNITKEIIDWYKQNGTVFSHLGTKFGQKCEWVSLSYNSSKPTEIVLYKNDNLAYNLPTDTKDKIIILHFHSKDEEAATMFLLGFSNLIVRHNIHERKQYYA